MLDARVLQGEPSHRAQTPTTLRRVVDLVVEELFELGVRHVFGAGGDNIDDLHDAVHRRGDMAVVMAKQALSAVAMADGYSRVGRGVGVVMSGSGGGALGLVPGLGESLAGRVPMVALVGEADAAFADKPSMDVAQTLQSVSVFCRRVQDPALGPELVLQAAQAALRLSGPAVVMLPKDIQQAPMDRKGSRRASLAEPAARPRANGLGLAGFATELAKAAPRVVIIAGDEVARHGARAELAELARVLGASVAVAPDAKDVISPVDRHLIGVAGSMGHPQVVDAVRAAGVCLLVGTRASEQTRFGMETALKSVEVLSLGERPPHVEAAHLLTADLRGTLRVLCKALRPISRHRQPTPHPPSVLAVPDRARVGVRHADLVAALDEAIPQGADIVVDMGSVGATCVHRLPCREGGRFLAALDAASPGYSFGAGVGCALARNTSGAPRRRTFVIAGDGAFYAHGMELHTALEHDLPITFVVCNNNAHGRSLVRERLFQSQEHGAHRFRPASISAGAGAMFPSLLTAHAQAFQELRLALAEAGRAEGPALLEVLCDPEEIPPFLPFLTASG